MADTLAGVWIDGPASTSPLGAPLHGRVVAVVADRGAQLERDIEGPFIPGRYPAGHFFVVRLAGDGVLIAGEHVFDVPPGSTMGDAFAPELNVRCASVAATEGTAMGDGFEVSFGGACPVQGDGVVDGFVCYYRARGRSWSLDVACEPEWSVARTCYVWPDGGWLRAEISRRNIEAAVAEFRAWRAGEVR